MVDWTDDTIALLREMFARGCSAGVIAADLGLTRGEVSGKLHRLGLKRNEALSTEQQARGGDQRSGNRKQRMSMAEYQWSRHKQGASLAPLPPPPPDATDVATRTLVSLRTGECKWPIGHPREEDFGFCGASRWHDDTPYCERHTRRAWNKYRQSTAA